MMKMNRRTVAAALASVPVAALLPGAAWAQKPLVLGFSQVGAESEWRTANTESIKSAAKEAGIALTPAGSSFPYKQDPDDTNIRLAPTMPPLAEVTAAMEGVATCVLLAAAEQAAEQTR